MIMRYHWGLGIGHTYSHGTRLSHTSGTIPDPSMTHDLESDNNRSQNVSESQANDERTVDNNMEDTENPEHAELGMSAPDEDLYFDSELESELGSEEWQDIPEEEDEEYLELHDMYHTEY
jgi:hypothetical protein